MSAKIETCLKCGVSYEGFDAVQVGYGNGICKKCVRKVTVALHVVVCADARIHGDGGSEPAIYTTRKMAETIRDVCNGPSLPCGPHRAVTLTSNRVRIMASNLDHAMETKK